MGNKNTAWGNKAYKETRRNGGSKQQAKQAANNASERYYNQIRERQFSNSNDYGDVSDFNNSKNNGSWHTSEDL
jgi:hypothetical protein